MSRIPEVSRLGRRSYGGTLSAMESFTNQRDSGTPDQIWLLEHDPVYTLGTSCKQIPRDNPDNIPVIHSNRGGQITYHGPGQLITYLMLDLKRLGIGPRSLVNRLEQTVIDVLGEYEVDAERRPGAPGIYVDGAKVAALGLRIRNGRTFHGLSLNVAMDLGPFDDIDPCGFSDLRVTSLERLGVLTTVDAAGDTLVSHLTRQLYPD